MTKENMIASVREQLENCKAKSAWQHGVKLYAKDLLDSFCETVKDWDSIADCTNSSILYKILWNGAKDQYEYSYGGCSLIYDCDIAERLCAPWELRKTRNGERNPNSRENWLDVQARALYQAARLLSNFFKNAAKEEV